MFFKKKDSHINIYEAHADERLYDLWAKKINLLPRRVKSLPVNL